MASPGEILRLAAWNRGRMRAREASAAAKLSAAPLVARRSEPRAAASHASYSALMRSHDRVNTCHLSAKG